MKKNAFITVLLAIVSILVIYFGRQYANKQEEEMLQDSMNPESTVDAAAQENSEAVDNETAGENLSKEEQLSAYVGSLGSLSLVELIDYKILSSSNSTLTYYGDINPSADWYISMNDFLDENTLQELTVEEVTYPESDTYELYIQQTFGNVIATEPSVVLYRMPAVPDKIRDIGISETNQYLTSIFNNLVNELPDAQIILMEPAPVLSEIDNLNSRSLDYQNYMNEMIAVAEGFELPILSTHERFLTITDEEGIELSTLFNADGSELNEEGTRILQQSIESELTTRASE